MRVGGSARRGREGSRSGEAHRKRGISRKERGREEERKGGREDERNRGREVERGGVQGRKRGREQQSSGVTEQQRKRGRKGVSGKGEWKKTMLVAMSGPKDARGGGQEERGACARSRNEGIEEDPSGRIERSRQDRCTIQRQWADVLRGTDIARERLDHREQQQVQKAHAMAVIRDGQLLSLRHPLRRRARYRQPAQERSGAGAGDRVPG